jgi:hypothetical protein
MQTKTLRRVTALFGGAALVTGMLAGFAGATNAAPGDLPPSLNRVIAPVNTKNLVVPTGAANGAQIVSVPRIGQADATPDSQVWTFDHAKRFDANGKVVRGALSFIFQPTFNKPGVRPLCIDVANDSTQVGAPFVLRPCDGTPSQTFVTLGDLQFPLLQNVLSGLKVEVLTNGNVTQQDFPPRPAANASPAERQALRARSQAQTFLLSPKSFGIGGA